MICTVAQDAAYPPPPTCPDCGCQLERKHVDCIACANDDADRAHAPRPVEIARLAAVIRAQREQERATDPLDTGVYVKTVVSTARLGRAVRSRLA